MTITTQYIPFPNGVSVFQSKKDAKNLKKTSSFSHTEALNEIAKKNGINKSWDDAITLLKITTLKNQPLTSEEQDLKSKLISVMSSCYANDANNNGNSPQKNTKNDLLQELVFFMQKEFGDNEDTMILTATHFEDESYTEFPLKLTYPVSLLASQFFYKCAIEVTENYLRKHEIMMRAENIPEYFSGDPSDYIPFYLRPDKSIGLILVGRSEEFIEIARAKDFRKGKKDIVEIYEAGFALNEAEFEADFNFSIGAVNAEQMNALLLSGNGNNTYKLKVEDLDFALIFKQKFYSTTPNGIEKSAGMMDYRGCYDVEFLYVNTLDYIKEYLHLLTMEKYKVGKEINISIKTFLSKVIANT